MRQRWWRWRALTSAVTLTIVSTVMTNHGVAQTVAARRDADHASDVLARPVTVDLDRATLKMAVAAVARSAGVRVQYASDLLSVSGAFVTMRTGKISLQDALTRLLGDYGIRVVVLGPDLITLKTGAPLPIDGTLTGLVRDAVTRQGVRGATVLLDDATRGVVTNDAGRFRIAGIAAGPHRVTIRAVGYRRYVQTVTIGAQGDSISVSLEVSANMLDQVVVTGTVIPTELKAVPNAITVITARQLEERGVTGIEQLFRGDVPGLFSQNSGSKNELGQVTMFSRGATSLGSVRSPGTGAYTNPIKTYVDGVELADPSYLSQIDVRSIERIEILTGPQASTIYGSNALNGVMQVFTKRGTTPRPQLTISLLSGLVQNDYRTTLSPQHDHALQLTGTEGRWSYSMGGSWNFIGAWTPSKRTERRSTFGGGRLQLPTPVGGLTIDGTLRIGTTENQQRGSSEQRAARYSEIGWFTRNAGNVGLMPTTSAVDGQTIGLTMGYTPAAWWSHELVMGSDRSDYESRTAPARYSSASDSLLTLYQVGSTRQSIRYATTVNLPVTIRSKAVMTIGMDGWRSLSSSLYASPTSLSGSLSTTTPSVSRQPAHNTGGFIQSQLGFADALFLTYGLRAEWNPTYGEEALPNLSPRYGVAYTRDVETALGPITTKLRMSYGRSTRPPSVDAKRARSIENSSGRVWAEMYAFGNSTLENPELGPELQQGGEGGMELYFGSRGSVIVTRYNQTVNGLIVSPRVDSLRSISTNTNGYYSVCCDVDGYGYYYQYKNLNAGDIRNQGWELQGSLSLWDFTTRATYSMTKSRVIGITPKYRSVLLFNDYKPGALVNSLPEHTWAIQTTYARRGTSVMLSINGTGMLVDNNNDAFYWAALYPNIRLPVNRQRMSVVNYDRRKPGYALADLNVSHRITRAAEGLLQIQNLTDYYRNDFSSLYASLGRQTKAGVRIRW
jgi:outer membrane receptor protein involved in Fe transport